MVPFRSDPRRKTESDFKPKPSTTPRWKGRLQRALHPVLFRPGPLSAFHQNHRGLVFRMTAITMPGTRCMGDRWVPRFPHSRMRWTPRISNWPKARGGPNRYRRPRSATSWRFSIWNTRTEQQPASRRNGKTSSSARAAGCAALEAGKRALRSGLEHNARWKIAVSGGVVNIYEPPFPSRLFRLGKSPLLRFHLTRYTPRDFIRLVERHGIPIMKGQLFCDTGLIIQMLPTNAPGGVKSACTAPSGNQKNLGSASPPTRNLRIPSLVIATGELSIAVKTTVR